MTKPHCFVLLGRMTAVSACNVTTAGEHQACFCNSDETEEVVLLLVKVKALRIAEEHTEEYKREHLKSVIRK